MIPVKLLAGAGVILFVIISTTFQQSRPSSVAAFDVQVTAAGTVLLQWKAFPDSAVTGFEVERSRNEKAWQKIAVAPLQVIQPYSFTDSFPENGYNYYRLKQIRHDVQDAYTPAKGILVNKAGRLYIWPNPVNDMLHVKTPFAYGSMEIIDAAGHIMIKVSVNSYITAVPVTHLKNGAYFLRVKYEDKEITERIVKI